MNYNARENELKKSPSSELLEIHKVNSLEDYIKARDQLEKMKELFDETGEKKPENDDFQYTKPACSSLSVSANIILVS